MDNLMLARTVGILAFTITIVIKAVIIARQDLWRKYGRVASAWMVVYFLFLYALRLFSFFQVASNNDLSIISGWTCLIPLFGIILNILMTEGKRV